MIRIISTNERLYFEENNILRKLFAVLLSPTFSEAISQKLLADSVQSEFLHAWNGYTQYAWGHDALRPLTKQPRDWYGTSFCMTPVDAYDVMMLMGLSSEAAAAKQLILDSLSFNKNIEVQSFEITIRLLGDFSAPMSWTETNASSSSRKTSANGCSRFLTRRQECRIAMSTCKRARFETR